MMKMFIWKELWIDYNLFTIVAVAKTKKEAADMIKTNYPEFMEKEWLMKEQCEELNTDLNLYLCEIIDWDWEDDLKLDNSQLN